MCGAFSPHDRSHVFQACRPSTSCRNSSSLVRSPSPKPIFKIYKIFKTFKIFKILKGVELIFIYNNQTPNTLYDRHELLDAGSLQSRNRL